MDLHDLTRELHQRNESKIVLLVADGLGGLPLESGGKTELATAATPNLDALARDNVCGLMTPVLPGITPGSGPGHLGLFGYDPLVYRIGRGVLEALGVDFDLGPNDVAARGNFCTVDESGVITDRRAGRISSEVGSRLVEKMKAIQIEGVELHLRHVKDYRFVVILRGDGLGGDLHDTDPGAAGRAPLTPTAANPASQRTAEILTEFVTQAGEILKHEPPANMLTLRGIARRPAIPAMQEVYGLRSVAIAVYPMYRGLARLVGMTVVSGVNDLDQQLEALRGNWAAADFFFLHHKYTDSTGEDGKFDEKVKQIETVDGAIPKILELKPDVLIVTGDHSTPSLLKSHSWHPVPVLFASHTCRPDDSTQFSERDCLRGGLGQFEAKYLMPLALAHAGRLQKFGA
ncbi:MAG: 2,3-bisphosphoglycerate-independent phosphoglycerate mutase [Armatimonadetes bacterium]|nr:2,3-bisphosphoglycerate-independent phosphoglycerate mutase [Armatimonadota bacterium]